MQKIKVKLVTLGNLKYPVDFSLIEKWSSKIFEVHHADQVQILPNTDGDGWSYSDRSLKKLVLTDNAYDVTIGVINARLEDDYYLRPLNEHVGVLSLFETADILRFSNLSIENFIIRVIYTICAIYLEGNRKIPITATDLVHDETRSCLFDFHANKADIVFSTEHPIICQPCKARIMGKQVPAEFLPTIENELKRIRKPLYYRLADFIRKHPVVALALTTATALLLNIAANFIYDCIK